jgi:uncharacterized paraquat-inducible protein A
VSELLEATRAAGLSPDQVDELQAWLLWQSTARARRARSNYADRRRVCVRCLDVSPPQGATKWGLCRRCANRALVPERERRRRAGQFIQADIVGLA